MLHIVSPFQLPRLSTTPSNAIMNKQVSLRMLELARVVESGTYRNDIMLCKVNAYVILPIIDHNIAVENDIRARMWRRIT